MLIHPADVLRYLRPGLVCLALSLMLLAGCGSPSGPVTHLSYEGVQVDLPGEGWTNNGLSEKDGIRTQAWRSSDGTMLYRVSTFTGDEFSTLVNSAQVQRYMKSMYSWAADASPSMLRGRSAYYLLAVHPDPNEFTMIEYALVYRGRHYFIGAGTTTSRWNSGGQTAVETLLDSVKLEEPAEEE